MECGRCAAIVETSQMDGAMWLEFVDLFHLLVGEDARGIENIDDTINGLRDASRQ